MFFIVNIYIDEIMWILIGFVFDKDIIVGPLRYISLQIMLTLKLSIVIH